MILRKKEREVTRVGEARVEKSVLVELLHS
jgi:hypothetical protein